MAEVFNEATALIQPLATRRNVHIGRCAGRAYDGAVQADRQRLSQVALNLLSNAMKYNRQGGTVSLSCEPASKPNHLRLSVSDTDPGIAPVDLTKLFTPFERLGAERGGVEGCGHRSGSFQAADGSDGKRIGVESTVGRGSTFYVELPLGNVSSVDIRTPGEPVSANLIHKGPTVLYIEDNPSNHALVEQILELQRPTFRLLGAMLGRLGLDMAREHLPELILLDLHLPDVTGEEVLQELRANESTHDIPVIMVSADATPEQPRCLLELGAQAYLTKPLKITAIVQAVDEALALKR